MRKLATVLSLLVLCVGSAAAQWNLAQDPAATLTDRPVARYDVQRQSAGFSVTLKANEGAVTDEIFIYRTGNGLTGYTIADASVYDATLSGMALAEAMSAQGNAAVLKGLESGRQTRPSSNVATTKVWYSANGVAHSMNFEIRWDAAGAAKISRLPDDVPSGTVQ